MASPTQWTWVWVNSESWWWTGRPGMLQSMGSQRVGDDWATELNWTEWYSDFRYFLQLKSEFGSKKLMIWATVSSRSCFCWLYRAPPSLAAKYSQSHLLYSWKRVFAMTSIFSWQNSVSLCSASFWTPGPCLPIILGMSWLPTLHFNPQWCIRFLVFQKVL